MMWTVILLAVGVPIIAMAIVRCRQANRLIARILVEELGPERFGPVDVIPQPNYTRRATEQLLRVEHN
jgi:hypothetical protein